MVGGGIIGAACALELAARGASVTLVEREHLAAGASGRNLGLLVMPDDEVLVPMYAATLDAYREAVDEAPFDVFLDRESRGVVQVALEESDLEDARGHAAFLSGQGIAVEDLSKDGRVHAVELAGKARTHAARKGRRAGIACGVSRSSDVVRTGKNELRGSGTNCRVSDWHDSFAATSRPGFVDGQTGNVSRCAAACECGAMKKALRFGGRIAVGKMPAVRRSL